MYTSRLVGSPAQLFLCQLLLLVFLSIKFALCCRPNFHVRTTIEKNHLPPKLVPATIFPSPAGCSGEWPCVMLIGLCGGMPPPDAAQKLLLISPFLRNLLRQKLHRRLPDPEARLHTPLPPLEACNTTGRQRVRGCPTGSLSLLGADEFMGRRLLMFPECGRSSRIRDEEMAIEFRNDRHMG